MSGIRVFALLTALAAALCAQQSWTSAQVVDFVTKSAKSSPDKDVAEYLKKVTLTDRFTDDALDSCIKAGAQARTRAVLISLVDQSATLRATKKPAPEPVVAASPSGSGLSVSKPVTGPRPPSEDEKAALIEKVTEYARGYIKNLPNFTCGQVTRRYYDPSNTEHFKLEDTVLERLSYFDGQEEYKVVSVNNTPTTKGHREIGGTTSEGEFGTDMKVLFAPETQTEFTWDSWVTWHGRRTHKLAYRVRQSNSSWNIVFDKTQTYVPGYHGFVYVDRDLVMIMRITREADDIPLSFPIQTVKQDTRYEFTKIGESEQEFLVPVESLIVSGMTTPKTGKYLAKNDTQFRFYNKYGTTSVFKVGDFDEKPEAPPAKKQN